MFKTELIVKKERYDSKHWILEKPLIYDSFVIGEIVVPAGFRTDLTTGWFNGRNTEASVVHDYLLDYNYGSRVANRVMNEALKKLKVRWAHRKVIMGVIRVYWMFKRKLV